MPDCTEDHVENLRNFAHGEVIDVMKEIVRRVRAIEDGLGIKPPSVAELMQAEAPPPAPAPEPSAGEDKVEGGVEAPASATVAAPKVTVE